MAVHARLGRRNSGKARRLNRRVAITAINSERGHMVLMAEGRGLGSSNARIGHVRRTLDLNARPQSKRSRKNARVNRGTRNYISAAMENLHQSEFSLPREPLFDPIVQPKTKIS